MSSTSPQTLGDPAAGLFGGRYALEEQLGERGWYGEVWRATDTNTGRTVALKLLDGAKTAPEDAWREATSLTSLESPHLLRVHGAAMAIDVPYIDTEIATGGSLKSAVAPLGAAEHVVAQWAQQIALGLDLCHRSGLVHRDVKPANVFLNAQGDALLGDFGKAAILDAAGTAACDGDPEVRAPELLKGARCTPASDVYALGMTIQALLVGELPFRFEELGGFKELKQAAISGPPPIRDVAPHVSRRIKAIIEATTSPNPQDRPTAGDAARALSRVEVPRRVIREVAPQAGTGREWLATPVRNSPAEVRVTARRDGGNRWAVEARRTSDEARLRDHCAEVTTSRLPVHLRAVFDSLRD